MPRINLEADPGGLACAAPQPWVRFFSLPRQSLSPPDKKAADGPGQGCSFLLSSDREDSGFARVFLNGFEHGVTLLALFVQFSQTDRSFLIPFRNFPFLQG